MKRIIMILGVLLALAVLAVGIFVATFDVNRYKPALVDFVQQRTGRAFAIDGDLALRPSLIPTVAVEKVAFGNPPWASRKTMVTVERLEAQAALLPLLQGRVEIERVAATGTRVALERDRSGTGNWVIGKPGGARASPAAPATPAAPGRTAWQFEVRELIVSDAVFTYAHAPGAQQEIAIDRITLGGQGEEQALAIAARARYHGIAIEVSGSIAPLARLIANEPYALDLAGHAGALALTLRGTIDRPASATGVKFDFEVTGASLASIGDLVGQKLPAIAPLSLSGSVTEATGGYAFPQLRLALGRSAIEASAAIELSDPRPRIRAKLDARRLDVTELLPPESAAEKKARVFPSAPLSLAALRAVDASLDLDIAVLALPDADLARLEAAVTLDAGRLAVTRFAAAVAGGTIVGVTKLDASTDTPRLEQRLTATGVVLAQIPALAAKKLVEGARTNLSVEINGGGRSVAEIMAHADGHLRIDVGPGKIHNRLLGVAGGDLLVQSLHMLNPLAETDDTTGLECAVIQFPIAAGRAAAETGIGIRTDKLNILGGGSIDFASEAINLGVKPKPREGIGLNLSALSDFVRIGGTLARPRAVTNARGMAKAGAKVGAAFATGGLSVLAEGLFDRVTSDVDVCAIARGDQGLEAAAPAEPSTVERVTEGTKNVIEGAGNAVKGVFKGLFGR